jgi:DNA (cytosine-5)-methyltransferase 1
MQNGALYPLPTLVQTISVKEFGSEPNNETFFHTPTTTGLDGGSNGRKALKKRLEWPTPSTKGYGHAAEGMVGNMMKKIEEGTMTKLQAEQLLGLPHLENHRTWKKKFPTPTAHNAKETNAPSEALRNEPSLASIAGGALNPTWVEWLMGWPLGWTDLKPLEMDKSLYVQQQRGNY